MSVRKNAMTLTPQEQQRFVHVVTELIQDRSYGRLVAIHADMRHDQHGSMGPVGQQRFLPWHRRFLLELEREMQAKDAAAVIPYWDWTADRAVPTWMSTFLPSVPVPGRRTPLVVRRSLGRGGRLPASWEVESLIHNPALSYTNFTAVLEGFHNEVHTWVGGVMGNIMVSPADPLFWLHHAQIDRLWSMWEAEPANTTKAPTLTGADATLDPWSETAPAVLDVSKLNYSYA